MSTEYSNAGELMGLNGSEFDSDLMGYLANLNPVARAKAIQKITKSPVSSQGSRAEFEKFFSELPQHIKDGLLNGKLRLADHTIYTIKPVNGSKTIKMFESQDVKEVGLRNISNAKLPKNMAMLVSGIILLSAVPASAGVPTKDEVMSAAYGAIEAQGALHSGEFTFKANKKHLLSDTSLNKFKTDGFSHVRKGYYKLANPRLIQDDVDIDFDIELGTVTGLDVKTHLFLGLHGTVTIP